MTANLTESDGSTPSTESSRREPGSPSCAGSMWGEVVGKKREALREACLEVCVPRAGAKLEDELADVSDP